MISRKEKHTKIAEKTTNNYRYLFAVVIATGAALRLWLFWINPPLVAFDDFYTPILLIMKTGEIPGKFACWECYHPPVFFVVSAAIGKALAYWDVSISCILKVLQFINCLYGILTICVVYLILKKLPVSDFARFCGLGLICFMPRHIYMSAMHGNDTFSYLLVALCTYILFLIIQGKHSSIMHLVLLSVTVSAAIFTKYTAFIIIPSVFISFALLPWAPQPLCLRKALVKGVVVLIVPVIFLGCYCINNYKEYGTVLPSNTTLYDPVKVQAFDEPRYDFFSFTPWLFIEYPILRPGQLNSFWTLMYSGMWFDTMPRFLNHTEPNDLWVTYNKWLSFRKASFPDVKAEIMHRDLLFVGSVMELIGLFFVFLWISGVYAISKKIAQGVKRNNELVIQAITVFSLFMFNTAGCMLLVITTPVYSTMKTSYILASLPFYSVFASLGITMLENRPIAKYVCATLMAAIFMLVIIHIIQLASYYQI